jgi:hypothetical protein
VEGTGKVLDLQFTATDGVVELTPQEALLNEGDVGATFSQRPGSTATPALFKVLGNHPNPFNPKTIISFYLPSERPTSVSIYNAAGRLVKTLADGQPMSGMVDLEWNGTNQHGASVSSGTYFARIDAGEWSGSHKMTLSK